MRYLVTIPIAGTMSVEVDAISKDEAISLAFEIEDMEPYIDTYDMYHKLTSGNVLYAPVNSVYVEEM